MGIERSGVRGEILWRTTAARIVQCKLPKNVARVIHVEKKRIQQRVAFTPRPEDGLSWATPTRVMISQRLIVSSKNFAKV
jgi:hypothetical protein